MKVNTILFPSSFFDGKKVDEDLQSEYEAVLNTGLWDTVFFNYDKWFNEGKLVLSEEISERIHAVHRGWMMKAEQYQKFYDALLKAGVELVTKPAEYEYFHYFPNVYRSIEEDTPRIITVPAGSWKILEAGDGSVSGPSEGQNLEVFYRAIYQCLN